MNAKKITGIFIGVLIAAIAIYDVYIIATAGKDASISWVIIGWSYQYPSFTFIVGFTMGHLFWRMHDPKKEEE